MFRLEAPIAFEVRCHHAEQEVAITGHQVTFHDLFEVLHAVDEMLDRVLILPLQPDADEDRLPMPMLSPPPPPAI